MLKKADRALFLSCLGLLMVLLCACGEQKAETSTHQTYTFRGPENYSVQPRAGDLIELDWKPQQGGVSSAAAPDAISLTAKLIGPFGSMEELQANIDKSKMEKETFAGSQIVAEAETILTDTWNSSPRSSLLSVPGKIQPGYYDLFYASVLTSGGKIITTRHDAPLHIQ